MLDRRRTRLQNLVEDYQTYLKMRYGITDPEKIKALEPFESLYIYRFGKGVKRKRSSCNPV